MLLLHADLPEGWGSFPRDLDKLRNCAHVNLTRFNKAKWVRAAFGINTGWRMQGLRPALPRRTWDTDR